MSSLTIRAEPKINALILVGTPINLEVVTELVAMLDIEAAAPGAAVRIYPLEHASAERLAPTIMRLFDMQVQAGTLRRDDRVIIQADPRSNSLIVTTSPTSFTVFERLLAMLDTEVPPELTAVRRLDLQHASAVRVAEMARQLMDARVERLRRSEPQTADLEQVEIIPDPRTNSLIVAAGPEAYAVVEQIVADLDRSMLDEDALLEVVPVGGGNVERLAEAVDAIMERRYAGLPADIRRSQVPLVLTDPRTSSLLVAAGPDDLAAIRRLVEQLEAAPSNPAIQIRVVAVGTARAEQLAPRVAALMRQRQESLGDASQPSDRVAVEADTATNSLVVAASEENQRIVQDLIDALGRAGVDLPGETEFDLVQLVSSRADEVVDLLGDLYVDQANRRRGNDVVRVTADERINAVLISAPADDVKALRRLVAQLDGAKPATVVEIRYVPLTSANALETVSLIQDVLSGRGIGATRSTRTATVLRYLREYQEQIGNGDTAAAQMEVSTAIRESITLTPDLRTNTVIISAPSTSIGMIERMIRDLDTSSMGAQSVRIFKLVNADAVAMAEILTDLFNLSRRGNLYVLKPREPRGGGEPGAVPAAATSGDNAVAQLVGAELTAVPDDRQELSLTVDNRTNSLIASGTPLYLDLVQEVVDNLDSQQANERDVLVYPLRNAVAAEVAEVITQFVEREQEKIIATLTPDQLGSASRLLEREVTVVGDEKSNTVLVSASPRYLGQVEQMINQLDVDPPQVLIQVMLAEISLNTGLEVGVDARFDLGPYTGEDLLFRGNSSLASAFLPTLGIPTFSVSTDDFSLLLKALETQGRIQVLSNPSVMAANNQPANIQVGEEIGRASSSSISSGGTSQVLVDYIDIGVILRVTPSINPDGFVRMEIEPEITDLTNETTQVTEDLSVPILTKRTARTTVTVRDGQTIVLGGLIQDIYELRKSKVPILGDIPLLGFFFRSEFEESRKIELLIVLTPHVITSPTQYARVDEITNREIDRMSLSEQEKQSLRKGLLVPEERDFHERLREERRQRWSGDDRKPKTSEPQQPLLDEPDANEPDLPATPPPDEPTTFEQDTSAAQDTSDRGGDTPDDGGRR